MRDAVGLVIVGMKLFVINVSSKSCVFLFDQFLCSQILISANYDIIRIILKF